MKNIIYSLIIASVMMLNAYGCERELKHEEECECEQRAAEADVEDERSEEDEGSGKTEIEAEPEEWNDINLDTNLGGKG